MGSGRRGCRVLKNFSVLSFPSSCPSVQNGILNPDPFSLFLSPSSCRILSLSLPPFSSAPINLNSLEIFFLAFSQLRCCLKYLPPLSSSRSTGAKCTLTRKDSMRELHESCVLLLFVMLFLLLVMILPNRGVGSAVDDGRDELRDPDIDVPDSGKGAEAEAKCRF